MVSVHCKGFEILSLGLEEAIAQSRSESWGSPTSVHFGFVAVSTSIPPSWRAIWTSFFSYHPDENALLRGASFTRYLCRLCRESLQVSPMPILWQPLHDNSLESLDPLALGRSPLLLDFSRLPRWSLRNNPWFLLSVVTNGLGTWRHQDSSCPT